MQKLLQVFNPVYYKYLIPILFLVIPLYPKFPLFNVPGTYVAIRAEDFLLTIMAAVLVFYVFKEKAYSLIKVPQIKAIILFTLAGFLSLLSGWLLTQTVQPHLGFLHWARRVEYMIPFIFVFALSRYKGTKGYSAHDLKYFMQVICLTTFIVFLYGLGQMYLSLPVISTQNEEYSKGTALRWVPGAKLHSTFAGHYDLAAFLVMFFPLAVAYFVTLKSKLAKLFIVLFAISPAYFLILKTEARISYLAFLIGVSVTLWYLIKKLLIVPFILISLFITIAFTDLGARYQYTLKVYKEKIMNKLKKSEVVRFQVYAQDRPAQYVSPINKENPAPDIVPLEDRSTSIRIKVEWPRALRAFLKNPLLGTGYSSITLATDNDYLRLLGEVGLVGTLAFALVLARLISGCRYYLKGVTKFGIRSAFVAGFMGAFAGILVNAIFIDIFEASKVALIFWTIAGLAVSVTSTKTQNA